VRKKGALKQKGMDSNVMGGLEYEGRKKAGARLRKGYIFVYQRGGVGSNGRVDYRNGREGGEGPKEQGDLDRKGRGEGNPTDISRSAYKPRETEEEERCDAGGEDLNWQWGSTSLSKNKKKA